MLYTYDTWGDVLSAIDMTDVTHPLTTRYQYDGWGNLIKTIHPTNAVETSSINWGSSTDMKYYIEESGTGKPTVKTWYDSYGRKTLCQYALPCGVQHKETYAYNAKDQVLRKSVSDGKLTYMELLSYDKLGRMTSDNQTQRGKNYSYAYGNRSVTTKIGGKSYTKTTDAWGNVKTSSDPVSSVSYVYNSMGKPVEINCEGSKTLVEYDAVGNKTSMTDPDAGTTTYEYAADGKLLKQTDARGIVTTNTYDELERLTTSHVGDMEITRTYGTSGNDNLQLIKTTCGNNLESYSYDVFGRLTSRTRSVEGDESHQYTYSYNMDGSIASVVYPGGLTLGYVYDANGYLMAKKYNNVEFKSLAFYDGITTRYKLLNTFGSKAVTLSTNGHVKSVDVNCTSHKNSFEYEYDSATDNLLSRTGVNSQKETFTYDGVDRLTSVSYNGQRNLIIKYANDGNILNKLDVGNYEYGQKPHAVMSVDNIRRIIPSATLSTEFNELGRIGRIDDGNSLTSVDFVYGPDMQRWKSTSYNNGVVEKTTFYDTDYDKVIDKNGNVTEFIYVDDNFVMLRKDNGTFLPYVVVKDNIGSIISIYAGDGTQVYSASYDAWGKQTVTMNKIGFIRGYCGHEMLNDYQIINMNGRLYDPVLGRFLSPDNYVQTPDFSQNYNRYSYCLNNPLKYTDPSGEFWNLIIGAAIGGVFNWITHGCQFNAEGLGYFATGALAGSVGAGVASGTSVAMAGGNFWSGFAGLANGISSTGFWAGAVTGASSGFAGGFLSGMGNSLVEGKNIGKSLTSGFLMGAEDALIGGISGGLFGGFDALDKNTNFWSGTADFDANGAYSCSGCMPSDYKIGESTIKGKYVGTFEGQKVFESKMLGNIKDNYRAFTVPDHGIIVADGVFTSGGKAGKAMMQHEFGHVLQYRKVGSYAYWHVIAPESLASASLTSSASHDHFWTETWANYLSSRYFGGKWIGGDDFPIKNISGFNMFRLISAQLIGIQMSLYR